MDKYEFFFVFNKYASKFCGQYEEASFDSDGHLEVLDEQGFQTIVYNMNGLNVHVRG